MPYAKRQVFEASFVTEKPQERITFADVRGELSKAEAFVAQMSVEELARVSVCASAGWGRKASVKQDGFLK